MFVTDESRWKLRQFILLVSQLFCFKIFQKYILKGEKIQKKHPSYPLSPVF